MNKQIINDFIKRGDTQGIILAYEIEAKTKEAMIDKKLVPMYNELSIIQRIEAKKYLDKGFSLGIPESIRERFLGFFGKTKQSVRSYWENREDPFIYYTSYDGWR